MREPTRTLRDISESVMRRAVGNRLGSEVLTTARVEISNLARDEIQQAMERYETGIHIVTVELQDVVPPPAVQPAFNEVNEARQERERMINEATKQANQEIPRARGQANRTIAEAEGYATERVNQRARRNRALLARSSPSTAARLRSPARACTWRRSTRCCPKIGSACSWCRRDRCRRCRCSTCATRSPSPRRRRQVDEKPHHPCHRHRALCWACAAASDAAFVIDQAEQGSSCSSASRSATSSPTSPACTGRRPSCRKCGASTSACWPGTATSARFRRSAASSCWSIPPRAGGSPIRCSSCARCATSRRAHAARRHHRLGGARHRLRHRPRGDRALARLAGGRQGDRGRGRWRGDVDLDKPKKGRERLEQEMLAAASRLMPELGIELVDVRIKRINYIDSVRRQVETG
jgi:hypothetical protein